MNPAIQRAYLYLVALVALHMLVLGAANVLRVAVELVARVTTSTFLGLPFVFAEGVNRPGELPREQLSLAIALVLVGGGAWWVHWTLAQRAALRDPVERGAAWRSFYLQLVLMVTALLVLAHGADALAKVLLGVLVGPFPPGRAFAPYGLEADWPVRVIGFLGMVVAAGAAWLYHARWSARDAKSGTLGARAIGWRRIRTHALSAMAVLFGATTGAMAAGWVLSGGAGVDTSFGVGGPNNAEDQRRIGLGTLSQSLPVVIGSAALWWNERRRAIRIARATGTVAQERDSRARAIFLGLTLLFLGFPALDAAAQLVTGALAQAAGTATRSWELPARAAGTLVVSGALWSVFWRVTRADRDLGIQLAIWKLYAHAALALAGAITLFNSVRLLQRLVWSALDGTSLLSERDLPGYLAPTLIFGLAWGYHRIVRERMPAEAEEARWSATSRRLYTYGFLVVAVAMTAVGVAGALGVAGSAILDDNTHRSDETALYLALGVIGALVWLVHWRDAQQAVARRGAPERMARLRRLSLGLAVLGGVAATLAFGAAAIFRVIDALLGAGVGTRLVHDVWHLVADVAVAAGVALFHARALRADRAVPPEISPTLEPPALRPLVILVASPAPGTRERVLAALTPAEGAEVIEVDPGVPQRLRIELGHVAGEDAPA